MIFGLVLFAALLGVYGPALRGAFIWDDLDLLRDNPLITAPGGLRSIWFTREATDFWPLTNSYFWLLWRIFGDSVLPFHVANVLLHSINSTLVLVILRKSAVPFAMAIATLFAFHPMNVEAVAWIFQAKTLLSTAFVLLASLAIVSGRRGLGLAAFAAALLCKISVVMFPFVVSMFFFSRDRSWKTTAKESAPYFALSLIAGLVNLNWYPYSQVSGADAINELGMLERLMLVGWTTGFYLWKTIAPYPLAFIHERWEISAERIMDGAPLIVLVAISVAIAARRSWRESATVKALVASWFLLFPALGLFTIYYQRYSFVADHWHYLSLPPLLAAIVSVIARPLPKKITLGVLGLFVVASALASRDHARHFAGPEALWSHAIERNPNAFLAYNNLGLIQAESGRVREAEANYSRALEIKGDYREALLNLGRIRKNEGRFDEAEALYKKAIEASPRFVAAYINLGALYGTQRRIAEAKAAFEKALDLDPSAAVVHFNLAALHQLNGDPVATTRELGLANKVSGLQALRHGEMSRAREFLEAAARHLPDDVEVRNGLAEASR